MWPSRTDNLWLPIATYVCGILCDMRYHFIRSYCRSSWLNLSTDLCDRVHRLTVLAFCHKVKLNAKWNRDAHKISHSPHNIDIANWFWKAYSFHALLHIFVKCYYCCIEERISRTQHRTEYTQGVRACGRFVYMIAKSSQ